LVASAEAKLFIAVLFGSFSCGYIAKKKNGENYLNVKRKRKLLTQSSFLFCFILREQAPALRLF
jgi:hypothetical protein